MPREECGDMAQRGSVTADQMGELIKNNIDEFVEIFDEIDGKDGLADEWGNIDEDFVNALFNEDERDLVIAGNQWNKLADEIKNEFIEEWDK